MNVMLNVSRVACALVFATAIAAQAQIVPDRTQLERRKTSVETLIEHSSAAKQVEASGSTAAQANREKARAAHRAAVRAFDDGDFARAGELFNEATRNMVQAVREAKPGPLMAQKARSDYDARLESVKALLGAQKRISNEKSAGARGDAAGEKIEALVAQANQLAAAKDWTRARTVLDEAYLVVRGAIGGMREGDTLVRSLHFANKEEEYRYEVDRNDTHRMLVTVLLSDKPAAAGTDPLLQRAAQLREQAEEAAGRSEFAAAIEFLESSTRELVRAIRSAGVYIPG